jgi:transcriptional regulator with XRE-family HTH domain
MAYGPPMAMLPAMLKHDRKRAGWSVARAGWELGMSIREYRELEAGARSPSFETWDRICKLFGWPQTFSQS